MTWIVPHNFILLSYSWQVHEAVPCYSECNQYSWVVEHWSPCTLHNELSSLRCGGGTQSRKIRCVAVEAFGECDSGIYIFLWKQQCRWSKYTLKPYPLAFAHLKKNLYTYLAASSLCCNMRDLSPWPRIEPSPPALGTWSPSHWIIREVSAHL